MGQAADAGERMLADRYRLVSLLGRGGMGAVWRAYDVHLDREVAVKELRLPEYLDEAARRTWIARLDREARAAARLRHPGIVTVHDRVTGDDGRPWIVMELVKGRSLDDRLKDEGRLPPVEVAQIGARLVDALRAAHRAGITHRDLKPANVLLEEDRVVLTDFGIAAVEDDVTLTATGAVLGTPAYMSPEQVRGQEVTAATDMWSLGATLYKAVEGRIPFEGASTGALFIAIASEDPAPPVHAGPLEPVLRALLHKDASQRPSADDVHARLTELARNRPSAPTPPPLPTPHQTAPQPPRASHRPLPPPEAAVAPSQGPSAPPQAPLAPPERPLVPPQRPAPPSRSRSLTSSKMNHPVMPLVVIAVAAVLAGGAAMGLGRYQTWRENRRYEANLSAVERMAAIPGSGLKITKTGQDKVEVRSVLCRTTVKGCDLDSQGAAMLTWFRSRSSVRSVGLTSASGSGSADVNPSRSFTVRTRDSTRFEDAMIYEDRHDRQIRLYFRVAQE